MRKPHSSSWRQAGRAAAILALASAAAAVGCVPVCPPLTHKEALAKVKTVAVVPFVDAPGDGGKGSGKTVVNAIIAELYQCPGIRVIEHSQLVELMKARDLKISSITDSTAASKLGKLAGADAVLLGEVTQYNAPQEFETLAVYAVAGSSTKRIHRVGLSVRAVNVNDGTVIYADLGQGQHNEGYSAAAKTASKQALALWQQFYVYQDYMRKQEARK